MENATKVSREQLEEPMEHGGDENYQEHVSSKKRKIDPALIRSLRSGVIYIFANLAGD